MHLFSGDSRKPLYELVDRRIFVKVLEKRNDPDTSTMEAPCPTQACQGFDRQPDSGSSPYHYFVAESTAVGLI